ncbi:Methionine aminopeptidase 1, mitochondrial (plasmid) [Sphingobium sp. AntQ-1]|uniref:M24 family metallopeptidase n=1 Tax=Sphingobium sp. AntQ-1 TaxID=2930091 RepID=UPI00234EC101|nr:M24 family metallopeptidase [Sphingobium sp. AntQ-1]WCP16284.1 Methionine aminopeptidase 1, mitochondrial [Sphingobium sp. AntQ-1]
MILWSTGWPQPPSNQYFPTGRKLATGDMISTECEARWGGYIAQNTQPLFVGKAPDEYHRMFALQQEAIAACYDALRPGNTVNDVIEAAAALTTDEYQCRLLMHARGLGDDSPIAIYAARDPLMRDWVIEENATFIVKPMINTHDNARRLYWGDTVFVTPEGAKRLGTRAPALIEIG